MNGYVRLSFIYFDIFTVIYFNFLEVVRMMQFVAQASHEIVPPDVLEPVLRALVNNFVTERNSSDVMAIG